MTDSQKPPLSTGALKGVGLGILSYCSTCLVGAVIGSSTARINEGLSDFAWNIRAPIGLIIGAAVGTKVIMDKRAEYQEAHAQVEADESVCAGMVQTIPPIKELRSCRPRSL